MVKQEKQWWWGAVLVALVLVAYLPVMGGGFIWDDPDYVVNNATLRTARGLWTMWRHPTALPQYYPLVHTTFWIEYQLWGLWGPGYHTVNVLLHTLSAVLLWRVLARLEVPGAWLAAAIWAIHPINAESVAWITERKNVLMGVFYFGAALAFLTGFSIQPSAFRRKGYWIALVLFVCAMLSKTVACSLPAVLLLVIWWKRGRVTWRDVGELAPMFVIGLALAIYTAHLEKQHVGAFGKEWDYSLQQRLIIAARAIWFYLGKIVAPVGLSFVYPKFELAPWQWLFPVGVVIALVVIALKRWRGMLVGSLLFIGVALPALGFINVYPMRYTFVADHYIYIASIGVIVLVAAGLARWPSWSWAVLLPLLGLTLIRASVFRDSLSLWTDTVAKNPRSWMVQTNYARALMDAGRPQEADAHFVKALELAPDLPETHWNVGINLATKGDRAGARREYDAAIAIDPKFAGAYYSRGNLERDEGDLESAKRDYQTAIACFAGHAQAHRNLGLLLEKQGDWDGAQREFELAIRYEPEYAEAHNDLGTTLVRNKQLVDAAGHFAEAVRIKPDFAEAHLNLGSVLAALGNMPEAQKQVREAVRLDPALARYADQALRRR